MSDVWRDEHRDYLEGRAADEVAGLPANRSLDVKLDDGRTLIFETPEDAVRAAQTILSEAEIAQRTEAGEFWQPTHWSVADGSPARLVIAVDGGWLVLENENGDVWADHDVDWELIPKEGR